MVWPRKHMHGSAHDFRPSLSSLNSIQATKAPVPDTREQSQGIIQQLRDIREGGGGGGGHTLSRNLVF